MREEKAPAFHRWALAVARVRVQRGGDPCTPRAAAAAPSPHGAPLYDSSIFILGAKPFVSDIAQGGEIIHCLFFLSPFPAVGLFF